MAKPRPSWSRVALDERVDAHELTVVVDERATGVARIDSGIGLDHVGVDGIAAGRAHGRGAIQRRDDTGGDRLLVTKRRTDRHDPLAHVELGGVADLDRRELGSIGVLELDDGQVARSIVAHELGLVGGAVVHGHHVLVVTIDHVVVGEDVALGIEYNARADAARAIRLVSRLRKRAILAAARSGGNGNHGGQRLAETASASVVSSESIEIFCVDEPEAPAVTAFFPPPMLSVPLIMSAMTSSAAGTAGECRNKDRQLFGLGLDHRVLVYNLLATQRLTGLRVVGLHVGNVVAIGSVDSTCTRGCCWVSPALPASWGRWESFSLIAAILSSNNQRPAKHVAGIIVHVELYPKLGSPEH